MTFAVEKANTPMPSLSRYLDPALVERLAHLQLSARRVVEGSTTGLHKSPFKGASVEFRQHRIYVPGDEPRRLDWRVLARTDRPYVKEYEHETNLRCMILLDASASMGYAGFGGRSAEGSSKFGYAARIVAALAYLMLGNTEHVGLGIFSQTVSPWIGPSSVTGQLARILQALDDAKPAGSADPARAMHQAAEHLGRRSLVILISDFLAPVETIRQGLAHLGHDHHEIIALRVLHRDEIEFPFKSWTRFRGLEGETARLCEPALARGMYLENFQHHQQQLQDRCRALQAQLATFITDEALTQTLTRFLQHRETSGV